MGEFFKGWKRKAGLVTLLMACMFMGGWVRSSNIEDILMVPAVDGFCFLHIGGERISCGIVEGARFATASATQWTWLSSTRRPRPMDSIFYKIENLFPNKWEWKWCDFYSAERKGNPVDPKVVQRIRYAVVPIWSITIPLTFISFWLLLSKPRQSIQKKTTEPVPVEGT